MEEIRTVKDNRLPAIIAAALLVLLVFGQVSPASTYSNKLLQLDNSLYDSLDTGNLEDNNVNNFTPDFIQFNAEQNQNAVSFCSNDIIKTRYVKRPVHSFTIRSPPYYS